MLQMNRKIFVLVALLGLSACSSPTRQAPIEDRSYSAKPNSSASINIPAVAPSISPSTNGSYMVKPGDTLYSIALAHGRDYRELAQWNQLADPGLIKVGQVLQVSAPETSAAAVQSTPLKLSESVEAKPLDATATKPSETKTPNTTLTTTASVSAPALASATPAAAVSNANNNANNATSAAAPAVQTLQWEWPVPGEVIEKFDETRNKGIDLAGKIGDPVFAAEAGKVVYVGSGLRGYGNLVIVKHNDDFISAYAHNSKLLVQLNETVKRGQKIAEVGNSDADQTKLHFEIRYQGKPADPLKYLPARK